MMRFRNNEQVDEYNEALKKIKEGISMVMDGLDGSSKQMIAQGAEMAWDSVMKVCDLSKEMEEQFSKRENGGEDWRYARRSHEWNDEDDRMMTRRMRDSMGRYK